MPKRIAVLWIVLSAILGFAMGGSVVASLEVDPHQPTTANAHATNYAQKTSPPRSEAESSPKQPKEHRQHDWWGPEALLVYVTFPLALFTALLYAATQRAASDAKKSSVAALDQSRAAAQALVRMERPYVFISGVCKIEHKGGSTPGVWYEVSNHGKTPAVIERILAGLSTFTEPLRPLEVDFIDDLEHPAFVNPILATGCNYRLWCASPDGTDFRKVGSEFFPMIPDREQMFLWVIVEYRGPFTTGHVVSACWRLYGDGAKRFIPWGGDEFNYSK